MQKRNNVKIVQFMITPYSSFLYDCIKIFFKNIYHLLYVQTEIKGEPSLIVEGRKPGEGS